MFWGWKKEAKGVGHFLWHPQKAISRRFHSPPIIVSKIVWCVCCNFVRYEKLVSRPSSMPLKQCRVEYTTCPHYGDHRCVIFAITSFQFFFCYISMTTAATADLKKTQNVRKVELHTAYMTRKRGTFVWREKPDPHHQPYHSSTHLKCTQMI